MCESSKGPQHGRDSGGVGVRNSSELLTAVSNRRNAMDPMTGSRLQHACTVVAEQTVEVVRNHEDGT